MWTCVLRVYRRPLEALGDQSVDIDDIVCHSCLEGVGVIISSRLTDSTIHVVYVHIVYVTEYSIVDIRHMWHSLVLIMTTCSIRKSNSLTKIKYNIHIVCCKYHSSLSGCSKCHNNFQATSSHSHHLAVSSAYIILSQLLLCYMYTLVLVNRSVQMAKLLWWYIIYLMLYVYMLMSHAEMQWIHMYRANLWTIRVWIRALAVGCHPIYQYSCPRLYIHSVTVYCCRVLTKNVYVLRCVWSIAVPHSDILCSQ